MLIPVNDPAEDWDEEFDDEGSWFWGAEEEEEAMEGGLATVEMEEKRLTQVMNLQVIGSYTFFALAAITFIGALYFLWSHVPQNLTLDDLPDPSSTFRYFLGNYSKSIVGLVAFLVAMISGYLLMRTARSATKKVIPDQDRRLLEEIIRSPEDLAIKRYIELSSLTGGIGGFTKMGLTGLPLATIGLTLFFTIMSFLNPDFIDLTELTLGAFLGSYVQRSVGKRIASGKNGQGSILPDG